MAAAMTLKRNATVELARDASVEESQKALISKAVGFLTNEERAQWAEGGGIEAATQYGSLHRDQAEAALFAVRALKQCGESPLIEFCVKRESNVLQALAAIVNGAGAASNPQVRQEAFLLTTGLARASREGRNILASSDYMNALIDTMKTASPTTQTQLYTAACDNLQLFVHTNDAYRKKVLDEGVLKYAMAAIKGDPTKNHEEPIPEDCIDLCNALAKGEIVDEMAAANLGLDILGVMQHFNNTHVQVEGQKLLLKLAAPSN